MKHLDRFKLYFEEHNKLKTKHNIKKIKYQKKHKLLNWTKDILGDVREYCDETFKDI
jgi:hypothetical protein